MNELKTSLIVIYNIEIRLIKEGFSIYESLRIQFEPLLIDFLRGEIMTEASKDENEYSYRSNDIFEGNIDSSQVKK
jgi:hypothetical protein